MTVQTPNYLNTNLFQDGQAAGSITPSDVRTAVSSLSGIAATTQAVSYTLALTDAGTTVEITSASAVSITVPPNSSVAFDVGTVIELCQYGAGQVTIAPGSGVTLRTATGTLTTRAQYSTVSIRQRATDEWVVSGDLS